MDKEDVAYIYIYTYIHIMEYYSYIYNGILLIHRKELNYTIYDNMDGPGDYHTKWGKSDREKQIYDITPMQDLKKMIQMDLFW